MRRSPRNKALALAISMLLVASACGGSDDKSDGADGGTDGTTETTSATGKKDEGTDATGEGLPADTLVDYQTLSADNPNHIDPATADTKQGSQITELIYDGLTEVDSENEVVPDVATEWSANEDSTVYTFTLDPEAKFSNGEAITAETFKKSWERALNPDLASTLGYHLLPIKGAEAYSEGEADEIAGVVAKDPQTLEVTLEASLSDWPAIVSHTVFSPVPKEAYEATTASDINAWEKGIMIGNGPYKMSEPWKANEFIKVEANEAYVGDAPKIPKIHFMISKDVAASYNAFEAGEGDTGYIPPGTFADATEQYNNSTDPTFGLYYFGIAWEDEELGGKDNLAIRQAISMAIDRDRINEQVYDGARVTADGVTPPGIPGYKADLCGEHCDYDPDAAKALVEEWGKADTMKPIKIQFNLGGGHEDVATIVAENLEEIGLKVEQTGLEGETYFEEMKKPGGCHLCRAGWIWDYPSYYSLSSMFTTKSVDGDNLGRYSNPEFDAKVAEAAATSDEDEKAKLWNEAEAMLFADMAVIPISFYTNQIVYSDRIEGLVANGMQSVNYPELSFAG